MSRCRRITLVALAALATCSIVCEAQTANFEGTKIVDLNQFVGDWYIVASTPASGTSVNKCGHFVVKKLSENTFAMKYTAVSHKRNSPVVFNANGTVGDDVTETWQLEGSTKFIGPIKQIIIEGNYDSYLATVLSGEKTANFANHRIAMIWSRDKRLSSFVVDKLKRKLSQYANKKDIFTIDQSSC
ncbi:uncharacterized protein LOC103317102 [Nasonia vitripennis]|uniref:Lipocalin/cytosolic fatty-acid binding domain-containing protein n=1 Tax=Nasonia vitripennis TaxID=7425 RepID=A0A7M7T7B3_NASVI|nr:uncharacterized protein LOC103317102 [Nasonia vitripennis]